jgi:hypothetical protein
MPPKISKENKRMLFSKVTIILKPSQSEEHHFTHEIRLRISESLIQYLHKSGGGKEKSNNNAG